MTKESLEYQIISNFARGEKCRIEPQEYWCDAMNEEEIMDSHLTFEEAEKLVKSYNE